MSTHNICFRGEIRKISAFFRMKKAPICCYGYIAFIVCCIAFTEIVQLTCNSRDYKKIFQQDESAFLLGDFVFTIIL